MQRSGDRGQRAGGWEKSILSTFSKLSIISLFSGRRVHRRHRHAFTLIEMMLVIALSATLMAMLASSLLQARNSARRAKAEAQLREMTTAFIQYYNTYGGWPPNVKDTETPISEAMLLPLIDPNHGANELGIVFLNKTFTDLERTRSQRLHGGVYYLDPWDQPFQMAFGSAESSGEDNANKIVQTTSVWFPNRSRRW